MPAVRPSAVLVPSPARRGRRAPRALGRARLRAPPPPLSPSRDPACARARARHRGRYRRPRATRHSGHSGPPPARSGAPPPYALLAPCTAPRSAVPPPRAGRRSGLTPPAALVVGSAKPHAPSARCGPLPSAPPCGRLSTDHGQRAPLRPWTRRGHRPLLRRLAGSART
nr:neural Wiskott-Aldrich syndrome protein-like [Aegilops tauschii subsp. strangulata]